MVAAWPVLVAFHSSAHPQLAALLAHLCGMLAGYAVVVLLALMSRAPIRPHRAERPPHNRGVRDAIPILVGIKKRDRADDRVRNDAGR